MYGCMCVGTEGEGCLVGWLVGCKIGLWRPAATPPHEDLAQPMPRPWMGVCAPLLPHDRPSSASSGWRTLCALRGLSPLDTR